MENLNQNTPEQEAPYTVPGAYNFEPECALPGTALTCLNGLRHGGRARMLFIPGEQPQDFFNMLLEDFETHKPATTQAGGIVTDATLARWFLWRRQRSYAKAEFELYNEQDQEDTLNPRDLDKLEQFDRCRAQAERSLDRAMKGLRHLQKSVTDEQQWRAQHELQKERFALDVKKFELRQEQAALQFDTADYKHHIGDQKGLPVIEQTAYISHRDGVTNVNLEPSNEVVQKIIENKNRFTFNPPQMLNRSFYFAGGIIPPCYEWIKHHTTPEQLVGLEKISQGIKLTLPFPALPVLFAGEGALKAAKLQREKNAAA